MISAFLLIVFGGLNITVGYTTSSTVLIINSLVLFTLGVLALLGFYLILSLKPQGKILCLISGIVGLIGYFIPIGTFGGDIITLTWSSALFIPPLFALFGGILDWVGSHLKVELGNE